VAKKSSLRFSDSLNPLALMSHLQSMADNCFLFFFEFAKGKAFLGASPERLYKRSGNKISTEALAGTRPSGETVAENRALRDELLTSAKDLREHNFVIEMILKTLKPFCEELKAASQPSVLNLVSAYHLLTPIEGILKEGIDDAELLFSLHPTPAIAGSPTQVSLEKIRTLEPFHRGWYGGVVGYLGKRESEFAVAIRCGLLQEDILHLYAGAGIVKGSRPQEEWQEVDHKLKNFLKIFSHVDRSFTSH
jgi:menaquinone-specific isochorismate synthase